MSKRRTFDAVIRVSRVAGRKGDAFMSPAEQREAIERRAAQDDVTIAAWWDETDSVSGGTVDREGLQAAIARAVVGRVDGILVAKVDRFARTVQGGLSAINQLEDAGRELWSAREGVIVGDEEATATDKLMRTFFLMLAQWQRDTLAEGWAATRRRHIANGVPNHARYGYEKNPTTRRLAPRDDEAPWVKPIFEHRAEGWTWERLADWLNEQQAPTREGGGWAVSSVRQIVQSRVYLGEIRSGDVVNEAAHDPLVSFELWQRANSLNKTPQRREAGQFVLSGLLRCAGCGVRMAGRSDHVIAGDKERSYRYYTCRRRYSFGRCPAPARVRADDIERIVDQAFRDTFLTGWKARPSVSTEELDAALAAQADAEAELSVFLTSPSTAEMRKVLGDEWVEEGQRARLNRVVEAREAVAEARNAMTGVALPANLAEEWPTMDVEDQRAFLADGFEVVAVARGRGPAKTRTRLWTRDDPGVPRNLPRAGGGVVNAITPIDVEPPAGTDDDGEGALTTAS
jgi:DNA invertase Pin-like site-specific DNA recombinase